MKKYRLLVAPLLSVAFLASCGEGSKDSHVVTEQEFNDACSFKDVQYVQSQLTSSSDGSTFTCPIELSPTVSHMINESSYPSYYETFTLKKDDGTYEKATRTDKSKDEYSFEIAGESDFITPQSVSFNVLKQLQHVGLSFKSFTYDSKTGTYSASFTPEGSKISVTTTLKFENKILISDVSVGDDGSTQTSTFTYEKKTPKYPEGPGPFDPNFVTESEFYAALSFEGVEFAQFNIVEDTEHGTVTREDADFAPGKFHLKSHNFTKGEDTYNCDIYVTKEENSNPTPTTTYKRYQPITDTTKYDDPYNCLAYTNDAWEVITNGVETTEFKTPKDYVDFSGITYDASAYDSITHYFVIDGNYYQFEDKKLTIAHNTTANMTFNIDYEEEDIDLPDVTTPISYEVDEDVWNAYKESLLFDSDMATFFATEEPVTTKNEIKCVYSEDLIYGLLNQSPISNANVRETYSFHETSYEEPQDIYYDWSRNNSETFIKTEYGTRDEWFKASFAGPTYGMIQTIFNFNKSVFQFDSAKNLYYANNVDVVRLNATVQCDLKVAFINNQLVFTDILSNDGTTIKEHVDVFAKNSFIEVPEFPEPGLN